MKELNKIFIQFLDMTLICLEWQTLEGESPVESILLIESRAIGRRKLPLRGERLEMRNE